VLELAANPAQYGFVDDLGSPACLDCSNGTVVDPLPMDVVDNPDAHFVWDPAGHPSAAGHRLMGERALVVARSMLVPEPATMTLMAIGLLVTLGSRLALKGS
jgi:phospholipase/lecithinase/hemolysin